MALLAADELHITNLAVAPSKRRSGIADRLLEYALNDGLDKGAAWCQLEVRKTNTAARALYRKHGFRDIGVRRGYYQDGEDAVVMGKELL
jgi:ribosomal-protein-alanine N-acetyltransferase